MDIPVFKKLLEEELISETEFENIKRHNEAPVSVYWDLTTLLYVGILLLTGGLGILVYKNIDSIGHTAIVTLIACLCLASFAYCFKNSRGYSNHKMESPTVLFDYVLLLACLLLLTFIGYLQFEYNVFGNDWGMVTFVPMVLLFFAAYYFDHLGVLSMAITNLAAWAGFTVAPMNILRENDFTDEKLIYTALILGAGLLALAFVSTKRQIKAHFATTYKNFGTHILLISILAGLFHFDHFLLIWFLILAVAIFLFFTDAIKKGSFYFLVVAVLYGYIGVSYVVCRLLWKTGNSAAIIYLTLIYFIATGIGLIKVLIHYNKLLKKNADLQ